MEKRRLGNTDINVSVLGFGGSEIGYESASLAVVIEILNTALDAGLNVIDTAECYVTSEELIGRAIGDRRADYYLFTKCGHERGWSHPDWRPVSLRRSIERSLKRLKTDYVDLLQLHSCSEAELRKGDVIEFLKQARQHGYTRYIGYSGDGRAAFYAVNCGEFDTLQTSINIADQEALDLTLPVAWQRNMGVIAKRPLANVAWANGGRPPKNGYGYPYWERLQKLKYDFLRGDLAQSAATALRFVLSVPGVHTAIAGTARPAGFQKMPRRWKPANYLARCLRVFASGGAKLQVPIGWDKSKKPSYQPHRGQTLACLKKGFKSRGICNEVEGAYCVRVFHSSDRK